METMYYIGLDVHKKTIDHCVKAGSGRIYAAGSIPATPPALDMWMKTLPQPWTAAMEATIFTAWISDHLQPHAAAVKLRAEDPEEFYARALQSASGERRSNSIQERFCLTSPPLLPTCPPDAIFYSFSSGQK
jgi:hypothetical protein